MDLGFFSLWNLIYEAVFRLANLVLSCLLQCVPELSAITDLSGNQGLSAHTGQSQEDGFGFLFTVELDI